MTMSFCDPTNPVKAAVRCLAAGLLILNGARVSGAPEPAYPKPGLAARTPICAAQLDPDAYRMWQEGQEAVIEGKDQGPAWVLWTSDGRGVGHGGTTFGKSKVPGDRHLRIGFTERVPVGTVLAEGNVRVSALKADAVYPGDMGADGQWIPAERLDNGAVSLKQTERNGCALWALPHGTTTRALRFTHTAAATDASYEGYLGGALVLADRLMNLAPYALPAAKSNDKNIARIINGTSDGWSAWANMGMGADEQERHPVVSNEHPEWIMLAWRKAVELDGLAALFCGFGAGEIQSYAGPSDRHPRDASEADWKTLASPDGFESGFPSTLWPNIFYFAQTVTTRAIRFRITRVTRGDHPHIKNKPMDGRRIWLGELMAFRKIGAAALEVPAVAKAPVDETHAPIPVPFTLPAPGYVTLVIENAEGMRIRNLVSETFFPAGDNIAWWDGTDDLGRDIDAANHGLYNIPSRFVGPGTFKVRGLWRKEVKASYEFAVYSHGNPPWNLPDHTGAWLANHSAPSAAVFVPAACSPTRRPAVFLGAEVTEGPDGLAWVDLDGRKRGGMKWIGGNWTAAPFLCRDLAPDADTNVSAYVASVWETEKKSGVDELRITALVRDAGQDLQPKAVHKAVLDRGAADKKGKREALGGVAAYGGSILCTLPALDRLLRIDAATGAIVETVPISNPRGLTFDATGCLYVLSGTSVLRFSKAARLANVTPVTVVAKGLEDPSALALDAEGNLYVSDRGDSHQVKIFSPAGKALGVIGRPGAPKAGPYDPLHINNPAGLAVDSENQVWVTENDYLPKRVSVWSRDGRLQRAFYGPGKYGGGGMLDAHDKKRFYYADETKGTLEFELDWAAGTSRLTSVLYRKTPESLELPFRAAAPETALYRDGKRYLINSYNSSPVGGHNTGFLFIERDGVAQPVAGMGQASDWPILKTDAFRSTWPEGADLSDEKNRGNAKNQALFIWTDANGDANVQPDEVKLHRTSAGGVTIMEDLSFCLARVDGRAMRFAPARVIANGTPFYAFEAGQVIAEGVQGPKSSGGNQMLADSSDEAVITLGVAPFDAYSISGTKAGKAVWSYPNLWPGLHASHHAARPDRPGQVIGVTRMLGGFVNPKGSEVGPLWGINGNMGNFYLFTRDGLFVATLFEDVRQGTLWKMSVAERGMLLKGISLHDENFWPSLSQTPEGQVYAVDGSHCSLVRLDGLESLRRIDPVTVTVTPKHLAAAVRYVEEREAARQKTFGSGILAAELRSRAPVVDGKLDEWLGAGWVEIDKRGAGANFNSTAKPYNILATMAAAGGRLYAAWDTSEAQLLKNSGELTNALFKTGGALDLMLATDPRAKPARREPVAGDLRLLITRVGKTTRATLYRPVAPGTPATAKVPFSSPWRTITFDCVEDISAQVEFAEDSKGAFEISVPLKALGLTPAPGLRLAGDIGILRGNGSETTARVYWSNKATGITADVPSEAALTPALWGQIEWRTQGAK